MRARDLVPQGQHLVAVRERPLPVRRTDLGPPYVDVLFGDLPFLPLGGPAEKYLQVAVHRVVCV
jgi:hypothetical protein